MRAIQQAIEKVGKVRYRIGTSSTTLCKQTTFLKYGFLQYYNQLKQASSDRGRKNLFLDYKENCSVK